MQKKIKNIIINIVLQAFLIIILILAGSCNENLVSSEENLPYTIGEALISDDFSGNLSQWTIEGATPKIVDGGKYHFKLLFFEKTIELYLNDSRLFRYEDSQTYTKGNFGLTASASRIVIDNFVITHLLRP